MAIDLFFKRFTPLWQDEDEAKAAFVAHNEAVRAAIPTERLVEWQPGDGWEPICNALGLPVPDEPYPHVNTTADFRTMTGMDGLEAGRRLEAFASSSASPNTSNADGSDPSEDEQIQIGRRAPHRHVALLVRPLRAGAVGAQRHDPLALGVGAVEMHGLPVADDRPRGPPNRSRPSHSSTPSAASSAAIGAGSPAVSSASQRCTATSWACRRNQNRAVWSSVKVHIGVDGSVAASVADELRSLLAEPGDQLGTGRRGRQTCDGRSARTRAAPR